MNRARVLVADDNAAVARQLRRLLADAFDVVGVVADGLSLLRIAREQAPDVVVTDIAMPGMDGLQAAETLASEGLGSRFVFITVHAEQALVQRAQRLGPCGYVLKPEAGEDLITAVQSVLAGHSYLSPSLRRETMR
jgi:DNA-binding NarL/FixJ family response regulator